MVRPGTAGWPERAGCYKRNANTSELGGEGQPEPEVVVEVARDAVGAASRAAVLGAEDRAAATKNAVRRVEAPETTASHIKRHHAVSLIAGLGCHHDV